MPVQLNDHFEVTIWVYQGKLRNALAVIVLMAYLTTVSDYNFNNEMFNKLRIIKDMAENSLLPIDFVFVWNIISYMWV